MADGVEGQTRVFRTEFEGGLEELPADDPLTDLILGAVANQAERQAVAIAEGSSLLVHPYRMKGFILNLAASFDTADGDQHKVNLAFHIEEDEEETVYLVPIEDFTSEADESIAYSSEDVSWRMLGDLLDEANHNTSFN